MCTYDGIKAILPLTKGLQRIISIYSKIILKNFEYKIVKFIVLKAEIKYSNSDKK